MPPPIPVTVLTGFLGSGKTTVLNRLLRHPGMADAAVIVNELGAIGGVYRHPPGAGAHEAAIRAHVLYAERPASWAGLAAWCELMGATHGEDLLRVKGLVGVAEIGAPARPVVVHGVHRIFDRPVPLDAWPDADRRSRLVVIARGLDAADLQATLAVLALPPGSGRPASFAEGIGATRRGET